MERDVASLEALFGSTFLVETYFRPPGSNGWTEEALWHAVAVDPEYGLRVEREPRGSGHFMCLGWDPEKLHRTEGRVWHARDGREVAIDYHVFRTMRGS